MGVVIKMAKFKMIKRYICGDEKAFCETCKKEIPITASNIELEMPYCSECGKIVLDCSQNYCCWCGEKFGI